MSAMVGSQRPPDPGRLVSALVGRPSAILPLPSPIPMVERLLWLTAVQGDEIRRLADDNRLLRSRLRRRVRTVRRLARLRAFFSPPVSDLILSRKRRDLLRVDRREVTVVFLDLRDFTAFAERADPEAVVGVLREFQAKVGAQAHAWGGTIERFVGDGLMVFFNAPGPMVEPVGAAVGMALDVMGQFQELRTGWRRRGHLLDLGIGVAHGSAMVGVIGFEGRRDYGVIGSVTNLAARLCAEARASEILASPSVVAALEGRLDANLVGELDFKGFGSPTPTFRIRGLCHPGAQPGSGPDRGARSEAVRASSAEQGRTTPALPPPARPPACAATEPLRPAWSAPHAREGG